MSAISSESSGDSPARQSAWSPLASLPVVPVDYVEAWDSRATVGHTKSSQGYENRA